MTQAVTLAGRARGGPRAELRVWDDAACRKGARRDLPRACRDRCRGRHPLALELLRQAGAGVTDTRARLPRALVEQALAGAPASAEPLKGRAPDGSLDRELTDGQTWFGTGPDCLYVDRLAPQPPPGASGRRRALSRGPRPRSSPTSTS